MLELLPTYWVAEVLKLALPGGMPPWLAAGQLLIGAAGALVVLAGVAWVLWRETA